MIYYIHDMSLTRRIIARDSVGFLIPNFIETCYSVFSFVCTRDGERV